MEPALQAFITFASRKALLPLKATITTVNNVTNFIKKSPSTYANNPYDVLIGSSEWFQSLTLSHVPEHSIQIYEFR